uniref:Putative secreted protein n=1 Tax=Ixodes scapularis TaxID=6945 RepID=Q4PMK7_IXOSC|nr:putative secreted protein [Ixodes scapularis]
MVDDSMKNIGHLFFIMRTTRLIVAMFVLFAICKSNVAGVEIKGAENIAPNCEKKIIGLCNNSTLGKLKQVLVNARMCQATCTYKPDPNKDTRLEGGMLIRERNYEQVHLPDGMPCSFWAKCSDGKCSCRYCDEGRSPKQPR